MFLDENGRCVYEGKGIKGEGKITDAHLWSPQSPYLYQLEVCVKSPDGVCDEYRETFGFREISIKNCKMLLNGDVVYLKGFWQARRRRNERKRNRFGVDESRFRIIEMDRSKFFQNESLSQQ